MKQYEVEGQAAGGAVGGVITLIVGVGVAVLVLIFVGSLGGQTYNLVEEDIKEIGNNSQANTTFIADNSTAQFLGHNDVHVGAITFWNGTTNNYYLMSASNFTIDYDAGTALLKSGSEIVNGSTMVTTYNWGEYEIGYSVKNGIVEAFNALETTGDYTPILVLAIVIFLVLGIVLGMTAIMGKDGGSAL